MDENIDNDKSDNDETKSTFIDKIREWKDNHFSILVTVIILFPLVLIFLLSNSRQSNVQNSAGSLEQQHGGETRQLSSFSSFFSSPKELVLELVAEEQTWIQLSIDDSATTEYLFKENSHATWNAKNNFLMRIGNAGGIKLILNGRELDPVGNAMQVKDILITESGIEEIQR